MSDDDFSKVTIGGVEGTIEGGLESCHSTKCEIMLEGGIYVMTLKVGDYSAKPIRLFCSMKCYFEHLPTIDEAVLKSGALFVYEVGGRQ